MALVSYSDSEGSDSEAAGPRDAPAKPDPPPTGKAKPSFQKVVDRKNPGKIRVNLPGAWSETSSSRLEDESANEAPPAKRARTAGAFGGFNSFLPAPKAASKPLSSKDGATELSGTPKTKKSGMASGVNLKTGAAPAFSREARPAVDTGDVHDYPPADNREASREDGNLPGRAEELSESRDEIQLVGKPTMFKPLSVARNATKKKKKPPADALNGASSHAREKAPLAEAPLPVEQLPPPKPKQSLFSSYDEDAISTEYAAPESKDPTSHDGQATDPSPALPTAPSTQPGNLQSLAEQLNLSEAERRQLFGRKGKIDDARLTQFSLAAEYAQNNQMIQNNETGPAHNPVRSIQPGKHSLQQLVNAATNQKEALEESFATGRRNKKDAGNRYGWT